ncbi:sugar isomerase domain-containing protein [Ruthenibacterium sp. TH_2024_36131]|uniref:sugar isomerase domain-containing protein n=1 Tax=Owariibacterium komagatae TaxID=3136601 RepID=UPI0038B2B0FC
MGKTEMYFDTLHVLMERARAQAETVRAAAACVAESIAQGGMLYAFGTGHSHMFAEELFYRAGGLVDVYPVLEEGLMLHSGAAKSTALERMSGYAHILMESLPIREGDVMVIASNSGGNAVSVEMAAECRARGVRVIALTSLAHSRSRTPRNPLGKRLYELADWVLDNGGEPGDACMELDGGRKTSPTSTVVGCALLEALVAETATCLQKMGKEPRVFASSNTDGGDMVNQVYCRAYAQKVKAL